MAGQERDAAFEGLVALFQQGRPAEADAACVRFIERFPDHAGALHLLGVIRAQQQRLDDAAGLLSRSISVDPRAPEVHKNLAMVLAGLNRAEEAVAALGRALALAPDYPEALFQRASLQRRLGRHPEALADFDRLVAAHPDHAPSLLGRALTLLALNRLAEALACYDRILATSPQDPAVLFNRGNVLRRLGRLSDAISSYDRALAVQPNAAEALVNRGLALAQLLRWEEALESYDRALRLRPDFVEALNNRGNALFELGRDDEAVSCFDRVLALRPDHADALVNRGNALRRLKRPHEALASYGRALAVRPDHPQALVAFAVEKRGLCDWQDIGRVEGDLLERVRRGALAVEPFPLLAMTDDPALILAGARRYWAERPAAVAPPLPRQPAGAKIRVGYLASVYRLHATAQLIAGMFDAHDRSRFEIVAFSHSVDDGSAMRQRLAGAFDDFVDVRRASDDEIARAVAAKGIDILVDLNGHTLENRLGVLARRSAPIQVHYLGYPGTLGTDAVDYLIADPFVAPVGSDEHFAEKLVRLSGSYQVNDPRRQIAALHTGRTDHGLPQDGFVFCCFNNSYKIVPAIFDAWMRILRAIPDSVLWLLSDNRWTEANLRQEAGRRGVDPQRLVFAPRASPADHLARHALADLFLDTLPYNAHTTASDALWTGLPVLTCAGRSFAARVAGSLLHSVGLPDLITTSLEDYEKLALRLATDDAALGDIRSRLKTAIPAAPLFDCVRTTRQIEAAYERMMAFFRQGRPPESFSV